MIFNKVKHLNSNNKKIGIVFSSFDLFHAGHVAMLSEARNHCDYLIAGLQTDPTIDRPTEKNKPVQSIVERQIQLAACRYVDEIVVYETEQDLIDILLTLPIHVRVLGEEYKDRDFTGRSECQRRGIELVFNSRDHSFSSSNLRKRVWRAETKKQAQSTGE
jgi:glycerol-3-phosphate cytidylyltransferase